MYIIIISLDLSHLLFVVVVVSVLLLLWFLFCFSCFLLVMVFGFDGGGFWCCFWSFFSPRLRGNSLACLICFVVVSGLVVVVCFCFVVVVVGGGEGGFCCCCVWSLFSSSWKFLRPVSAFFFGSGCCFFGVCVCVCVCVTQCVCV